ncbi:LysR substrate-binding domain-containing protein [Polaromonas sp. CT11-55]|uniref:LysR substrate-binding domain-containing protein n=1 Tax=Polaromonas sp. CT11-55 TaxID=3243045 RepID=UPI0039A6A211
MNYRQIECFRAVMHTGSMTLAATQLHTSQPNVSRAIALLQRETQLNLFERVGQRVVPTPEAQALLKEVDRVYVGLQSIGAAADRIRTLGVEGLRIAVSPSISISPVPRILQVFRGLRPRVPVVVHTADSATICKWVSSGYYELGLVGYVALPQEVDTELVYSERAVCIVPRGHRLGRKRKVGPSDLAGESFISFASPDVMRAAIDKVFSPEVRRLEIETSLATAACAMVARGLGVSIVDPAMLSELALTGVHALEFEPAIHFNCHVVRAPQQPAQALVADFLEAVRIAVGGPENTARKSKKVSRSPG